MPRRPARRSPTPPLLPTAPAGTPRRWQRWRAGERRRRSPYKAVIAVDQDPLGKQATIVSFDGTHLVLAKPLANGDVAVTLFNEGSAAATMTTSVTAIGLNSRSPVYTLTNLWTNQVTETGGTISAFVALHQTIMYRVAAPHSLRDLAQALASPPATTLAVASGSNPVSAGGNASLTVSLANNGVTPIATIQPLGLTAPSGWTLGTNSDRPRLLGKDDTDSVTIAATPPTPSQPIDTATFTGSASYRDLTGLQTPTAALTVPFVSPVSAPWPGGRQHGRNTASGVR